MSSPARGGISAAWDGARCSLRAYVAPAGAHALLCAAQSHDLRRGPQYYAANAASDDAEAIKLASMGQAPALGWLVCGVFCKRRPYPSGSALDGVRQAVLA